MAIFPWMAGEHSGKCVATILTIVLFTFSWSSPSNALERNRSNKIVISHDRGGDLVNYSQRVSRARHNNTHVSFKGKCQSACTMFLSLPAQQTCIARGASFSFHRAYGSNKEMNAWGTRYMLKSYPTWVAQWIDRNGGLSNKLIHMDYSYASKFLPSCTQAIKRKPSNVYVKLRRETSQPTR